MDPKTQEQWHEFLRAIQHEYEITDEQIEKANAAMLWSLTTLGPFVLPTCYVGEDYRVDMTWSHADRNVGLEILTNDKYAWVAYDLSCNDGESLEDEDAVDEFPEADLLRLLQWMYTNKDTGGHDLT